MHRISRRNLLKTAWRRRWPRRLPACSSPPIRRPGAASSRKGRLYINQAWWLMALPMSCVVIVVLGFNALGDGLRTLLDPIMRQ